MRKIPCVVMRGGTSRALFFHERDLPEDQTERDRVLLRALGSPDPKQIDGLGGGISSASKVAVIGPPSVAGADVDYTFAQVGVDSPVVDYKGNCGNISSAVGPFAIDEGMVKAREPQTTVRIHNTNTGKIIKARLPVAGGQAIAEGDFHIDGVPGTAARLDLEFLNPGGSVTGRLLPTGKPLEIINLGQQGTYEVSIVDAANPMVFVQAEAVGLCGAESPAEMDAKAGTMAVLDAIRNEACCLCGLAPSPSEAGRVSPAFPKVAIVASPAGCRTARDAKAPPCAVDLVSRMVSMGRTHKSYPVTGAICLVAAAFIPGTVVHAVARRQTGRAVIIVGHAAGRMEMEVNLEYTEKSLPVLHSVTLARTARRIMEGWIYVP